MRAHVLSALLVLMWASALEAGMVTRRWGAAPRGGPAPRRVRTPRTAVPTGYAVQTKTPPTIDGKIDEACWSAAPVLRLARTLDGGSRAGVATEVRCLRDGATLYVAVRAAEPLIGKLQTTRRSHDGPIWEDDSIEIFLGVAGSYFHFGVNASGSTYDARGKDTSWNSGFKAAAGRGKASWTIEAAIPLAKISPPGKSPTAWIANFNRNRRATGSWRELSWSPTYSGDSHVPGRFGKLLFADPPKETATPVKPPREAVKTTQVEILPASNGEGVVRFDLSAIPKGATIHRADLLIFRTVKVDGRMDEAMTDVQVFPQYATFVAGRAGKAAGNPLAIRGPWFDRVDATEAVRQWAAGKTNGGFFVKSCPFWNAAATCLDVAYEGAPAKVPTQVGGLRAFHRAGQTFITWREISDPVAAPTVKWGRLKAIRDGLDRQGRLRYAIYRHDLPIMAGNLHQAELIATVKPLSGWNTNGRNIDRPVDDFITHGKYLPTGHWNPFDQASQDGKYGRDCTIERLAIRDGAKPLPSGMGLYVHTTGAEGKAYYAVVTSLDGVQNTRDIGAGNSLSRPVTETAGTGQPVLQRRLGKMPFFNYPQKRLHYVRWVARPLANLPSQYYNWSVGVPDELGESVPLELNLHRDGHSYWRTHYRIERDSIVLSPHDFPVKSFWAGYHESLGTLKSFRQGIVRHYTEKRLLAMIDWAAGKWPVDRARVLVTGCRGGASGSGALHLAMRHPEKFNLVIAGHPWMDYLGPATATGRRAAATAQAMQAVWGQPDWDIKCETGESIWDAHDMNRRAAGVTAGTELPLITMSSSHGYAAARDFYQRLFKGGRAVIANFSWGGSRYIPVSLTGTYPNAIRVDVRRDLPLPAFVTAGGAKLVADAKMGQFNGQFRWRDVTETPGGVELTLFTQGQGDGVADITLRRLARFKVTPGGRYSWKTVPADASGTQSGQATAGAGGVLLIKGVKISPKPLRLVVSAQ